MKGRIIATSTLFRAWNKLGHDAYVDMLTAIKEAWGGDTDSISNQMLTGMTTFYHTYYGNFKRSDLVASLRKVEPVEILRKGKDVSYKNGYAREILRYYNKKRSTNRLDDEL